MAELLRFFERPRICSSSSSSSAASSSGTNIQAHSTQVNDSLYVLHKPEGTPNIQILFFHGLQFERDYSNAHVSTWATHDGSCVWPQTWLVEEFPRAHVLSVCYTEGLKKGSDSSMDMYNIGENLLSDLLQENIGSSCPVVLVGHSIGGLVIKELCYQAQNLRRQAEKAEAFLKRIKGVFFYSTPHHGSDVANRLKDLIGSHLLMYFETLSKDAARLHARFDSISKDYGWLLAGLGETLPTNLGPFVDVVVTEASARYGDFNSVEGADHFSICKPSCKQLRNFSKLQNFIHGIANDSKVVTRSPLPFSEDPRYVVLKTTMIEVRKALESKTTGPVVTLCGGPGQGKTSMARYLAVYYQNASDNLASSRFVDGVVFLSCGPNVDRKGLLLQLWENSCCQLFPSIVLVRGQASSGNVMQEAFMNESSISNELRRWLSTQKLLIILDDVWEQAVIQTLLFPGKWLKYLVTTQIRQLWTDATCKEIHLDSPTSEEASQILTNHVCGRKIDISPPLQDIIDAIVDKADRHPLVLANVAINIRTNFQGANVDHLERWTSTLHYFEDLIEEEDGGHPVVLFNHTYPRTTKASMTMALSSLSEHARTLLLVASMFESQPVPEVVFKLFFKRLHPTKLFKFSKSAIDVQFSNFIRIDSKEVPCGSVPERTWLLHAVRQMFIEIIKASELKSMGDIFLKCSTNDEKVIIELLLLYGQEKWRDQAAQTLGIPMVQFQNGSFHSRSLELAPIKSFVFLLHADFGEKWKENSHQLAKQILQKYIYDHELDDNSVSLLLSTNETCMYTLEALDKYFVSDSDTQFTPKTILALVDLLEPVNDRPVALLAEHARTDARMLAARGIGYLAQKGANRLKIGQVPNVFERLAALLVEHPGTDAPWALANLAVETQILLKIGQVPNVIEGLVALLDEHGDIEAPGFAAWALANLAVDAENRLKIGQVPNVIERLVALLAEHADIDAPRFAARALVNLAVDAENALKIGQVPNVIERLVALLAEDAGTNAPPLAAVAIGNLANDAESRSKIGQVPNVIERLVALLAEDAGTDARQSAAVAIANLAIGTENALKIGQVPNVCERLVALLADHGGIDAQGFAAQALANLVVETQISLKIGEVPNVIERLVALLAEHGDIDARGFAARALGKLAVDAENILKIGQVPNVIERLVALLAERGDIDGPRFAALALANLTVDAETRLKIGEVPNVIERLVAILAEDTGTDARQNAAVVIANLAGDAESRLKIGQVPNAIERLVALLADHGGIDAPGFAARALANLAVDAENALKIGQVPNVFERLVALLAEHPGTDAQRFAAKALANLADDAESRLKIRRVKMKYKKKRKKEKKEEED